MTLSSLRAAKCRGLSEGVWGLCPRQHLRPKSRRKRRLASETPRCGSVCGCLPQQGRPFTRRVYFAEKGTLHLVGSKSAPFGTALCPSLTPLPCPPLPTATASLGCGGGGKRLGPLPVTAVTTVTMFQTPPPPSKKPSRSSRLGRFQRQADTSPGVAPAVLIADVVVCQQLPGPDV